MIMLRHPHPTLEQQLYRETAGGAASPATLAGMRHAGAWLRQLHGLRPVNPQRVEGGTRAELTAAVAEHLAALRQPRGQRDAAAVRSAAERAATDLPATWPTVVSHGDFGPHNVFVDERGAVAGFDTVLRTWMPRYRDLARFLMVLNSRTLHHHRRRGRITADRVAACEGAFLDGYADEDRGGGDDAEPLSVTAVRLFELEAVLRKWRAGIDSQERAGFAWRAAKRLRMVLRGRALRSYVRGLVEQL